jgi:hypothetical protein
MDLCGGQFRTADGWICDSDMAMDEEARQGAIIMAPPTPRMKLIKELSTVWTRIRVQLFAWLCGEK